MKEPGNPGVSAPPVCVLSVDFPELDSTDTENENQQYNYYCTYIQ